MEKPLVAIEDLHVTFRLRNRVSTRCAACR
jgi:hypothetical protein